MKWIMDHWLWLSSGTGGIAILTLFGRGVVSILSAPIRLMACQKVQADLLVEIDLLIKALERYGISLSDVPRQHATSKRSSKPSSE